ncbi:ShlB/FhaC/HecB family hemolysin secretion/activation protein [Amorphus sp. MBR-141]
MKHCQSRADRKKWPLGLLTLGLAGGLWVSPASAQTAGQIVQPTYAPPMEKAAGGGFDLPGSVGLTAPAGADAVFVSPSDLVVEGELPRLAAASEAARARIAGRRVSAAELFEAAAALEAAYAREGYLLVRVSLPPQVVRDGMPVRFVVTDGYVEAIDVSALSPHVKGRVYGTLEPLVGKRGVRKAELERRLLLATDTAGANLRSTLKAGATAGGTVIVVNGTYRPVQGGIGVNNGLSQNLGTVSAGANVRFNSLFGLGETAYFSVNGYPGTDDANMLSSDPRNRQIAAGFILPLGHDGAWLNIEGVDSQTNPDNDYGFLISDHFQRLSTRLGYELVRSRDVNLTVSAIFDVTNETQTLVVPGEQVPFSEDRLRVIRLQQEGSWLFGASSQLSGTATFSVGLDAFGARSGTDDLPLSRYGAQPNFQKLAGSLNYSQRILNGLALFQVSAVAQTSFAKALPASEQISIGGAGQISSYDQGTVSGDTGAVGRLEVSMPVQMPNFGAAKWLDTTIWPYAFAAAGIVQLEDPTAFETSTEQAAAVGLGLRIALNEASGLRNAVVSLEYAHGSDSVVGHQDRVNLSVGASF